MDSWPPPGCVAGTLNPLPDKRISQPAQRLVEANRTRFDSLAPLPGAYQRRTEALQAALAQSRAEAAELHRRLAEIQASTSWRLTGPLRRVLQAIRMRRVPQAAAATSAAAPPRFAAAPPSYPAWIREAEPQLLARLAQPGAGHQAVRPQQLGLVVLAPDRGPAEVPQGCTVLTLDGTAEPACIVAQALAQLDVDMLCFLDAGDQLAPQALALVAQSLAQQPQTDLLFADEDWLEAGQRVRPFFKPGWDAELQCGRDLVGPFAFLRAGLVRQARVAGHAAWRYDLANQVAAASTPTAIRHLPAVLCHRATQPPGHGVAMQQAAAAQLLRDGIAATVLPLAQRPGLQRVLYELPQPEPLVSVIVPTRDRADLLRVCAEGVLHATDYERLELLVVDNGTVEAEALALLDQLAADPRVRVLRQPGPFNWSAMNNAAAAQAAGEVLVLLNNDIAVLRPDWLRVLVSHAMQPDVGAAGAKLLYPDGRVQHAGLTTDEAGVPRHCRATPSPSGWCSSPRADWVTPTHAAPCS